MKELGHNMIYNKIYNPVYYWEVYTEDFNNYTIISARKMEDPSIGYTKVVYPPGIIARFFGITMQIKIKHYLYKCKEWCNEKNSIEQLKNLK